jgi:thiamine-phosphate pyrophosphorylase
MMTMPARGLYAITPQWYPDRERLLAGVGAALEGGAAVLQFRDKSGDQAWREAIAKDLLQRCARHGVPLIINDDVGLAGRCGAHGVHLGRDDAGVAAARAVLGGQALVGVSCYNSLDRVKAAVAAGADYLALGSMYSSPTKPGAVKCELALLGQARSFGLPLVAIGGITQENGRPVIRSGADFLAVISGVFGQSDISRAARAFAALWEEEQQGN